MDESTLEHVPSTVISKEEGEEWIRNFETEVEEIDGNGFDVQLLEAPHADYHSTSCVKSSPSMISSCERQGAEWLCSMTSEVWGRSVYVALLALDNSADR